MNNDQYDPNSINAVLSRIETTLNNHVNDTREYRKFNDAMHEDSGRRVSKLEGAKNKIFGAAIAAGGLPHVIMKLFSNDGH